MPQGDGFGELQGHRCGEGCSETRHRRAPALPQGDFVLIFTCSSVLGCFVQRDKFSDEQPRAKELMDFTAFILFCLSLLMAHFSPLHPMLLTRY